MCRLFFFFFFFLFFSIFFVFLLLLFFFFPFSLFELVTWNHEIFLVSGPAISPDKKTTTFLKASKNGLKIGVSGFFCRFDPATVSIYIYMYIIYIYIFTYIYSISCTYTVYHVQIHSWIGPLNGRLLSFWCPVTFHGAMFNFGGATHT